MCNTLRAPRVQHSDPDTAGAHYGPGEWRVNDKTGKCHTVWRLLSSWGGSPASADGPSPMTPFPLGHWSTLLHDAGPPSSHPCPLPQRKRVPPPRPWAPPQPLSLILSHQPPPHRPQPPALLAPDHSLRFGEPRLLASTCLWPHSVQRPSLPCQASELSTRGPCPHLHPSDLCLLPSVTS